MIFPGVETHHVEIFLASPTILKVVGVFVHLCEADRAVSIVFKIDFLDVLFTSWHTAPQSLSKFFIKNFVGCCWYFGRGRFEVVKYLFVLGHLSDNKEDVFTGFLFHTKIHARAFNSCWCLDNVSWFWSLNIIRITPSTWKSQWSSCLSAESKKIRWCLLRSIRLISSIDFLRYFFGLEIGCYFYGSFSSFLSGSGSVSLFLLSALTLFLRALTI